MTTVQQTQQASSACGSSRLHLAAAYLAVIFASRLLLRAAGGALPGLLVAVLEDGMSVLSFAMGLLLLFASGGAPLAHVAKCLASPEGAADVQRALAGATDGRPTVRLYYFAL